MVRPVKTMIGNSGDDAKISELLQRIMSTRVLALGESEAHMVDNVRRDLART